MYIIDLYSGICVLVIYCCKMIPQKKKQFKTRNIYHLSFWGSWIYVQLSQLVLAQSLLWGCSCMSFNALFVWRWPRLQDQLPRRPTGLAGECWLLASSPSTGLLERPHNMAAGSPQSKWLESTRWRLQFLLWSSLRSNAPSSPQCPNGSSVQKRTTPRVWMPGGENTQGSSWRLTPTGWPELLDEWIYTGGHSLKSILLMLAPEQQS